MDPHKPRLRVLTMQGDIPQPPIRCSGGYRCLCSDCNLERAQAIHRGSRDTAQPWHVVARERRAA